MVVIAYLRNLSAARIILWCYLIWYLVTLMKYFDPAPSLWLTSFGLSGVIGFALYLSTTSASANRKTQLDGWQIFRLFLMPFCVSSFAALVKGRGFFLIFSPKWEDNALALAIIAVFCVTVAAIKRLPGKPTAAPASS